MGCIYENQRPSDLTPVDIFSRDGDNRGANLDIKGLSFGEGFPRFSTRFLEFIQVTTGCEFVKRHLCFLQRCILDVTDRVRGRVQNDSPESISQRITVCTSVLYCKETFSTVRDVPRGFERTWLAYMRCVDTRNGWLAQNRRKFLKTRHT